MSKKKQTEKVEVQETKKGTAMSETKKAEATAQTNAETQKSNFFDYFKFKVLTEYFEKRFKGEKPTEIIIEIKYFDSDKGSYFYKVGAMSFGKRETIYTEKGEELTRVYIKNLNINAKAISKEGKQYRVFNCYDVDKATRAALKKA